MLNRRSVMIAVIGASLAVIAGVTLVMLQGTTRYVAPNGSGTSACTLTVPCTLPRAASLTTAGDTILMRGAYGVYSVTAEVQITLSGTAASWITLENYPNETPILDATGAALGPTTSVLNCVNCKYVQIRGLEIRHSSGRGLSVRGASSGASQFVTVDGVYIHDVGERGFGGSGNDITLINSTIEYASLNWTGNETGGWAAGVSSFTHSDNSPSQRWIIRNNTIRRVHGECIIALRLHTFTIEDNTLGDCHVVYIDKADNGIVAGNVITQSVAWGRSGQPGDGFKLANEGSPPSPPYSTGAILFVSNRIYNADDCFGYWHDTRNTHVSNTYYALTISGNECRGNTGNHARFYAVGNAYTQPSNNRFTDNTCDNCNTLFGDTNDRASWTLDTPTGTPPASTTPTPTHSPSATPTPSATSTSTVTPTPSDTSTPTLTRTQTGTPTPSDTPTPTPLWEMICLGNRVEFDLLSQLVRCYP